MRALEQLGCNKITNQQSDVENKNCELGIREHRGGGASEEGEFGEGETASELEEISKAQDLRLHIVTVGVLDVSLYGADVITDGVQFATHKSNCTLLSNADVNSDIFAACIYV